MNEWIYNNEPFKLDEGHEYIGFIYIITNLLSGRKYIGKKLFHTAKIRQVNKKKKRYKVESDWKEYWSSSEELKADVQSLGKDNFKREILHLCYSKGECNYLEAREQFERRVIEVDNYYNSWISVRIRRSHIKNLQKYEN